MLKSKRALIAAIGVAAVGLFPVSAAAQGIPPQYQELYELMELVAEGANVSGAALATASVNSPFSPSAAGLSYDVDANTCGLSPWSRAAGEAITVNIGPASGDVRFGTGIVGIDYACTNINGNGLDVSGGIYAGGTTGVVTPEAKYAPVKFDIRQWLLGAYTSFSKGNFSANLKIQHSEEDYVGSGFAALIGPGLVPEGTTLSLSRTAISGAASYTYEVLDNTFLIPIVGFDVAQLSPDPIDFGNGFAFVPVTSTSALVYGGLTLAHSIILPNGTSAFVPFISGTYYADVGDGIRGRITGPGVNQNVSGNSDMSYGEIGAGFNYLSILDDGSGEPGIKQMTLGVRGFYKWNQRMQGLGGAASFRLQF